MYDNLTLQATAAAGSVAPAAAMPVDPLAIVVDFAVKQRLLTGILCELCAEMLLSVPLTPPSTYSVPARLLGSHSGRRLSRA